MRVSMRIAMLAALTACGSLAFAQQDFSKVTITAQKVAGNVHMLQGSGGNIGVSVGDDGIVIVDDQYAPLADKIRAALKGIADKPVRFVINTHFHGDHAGGNEMFSRDATLVAHDNVRKRIASGGAGGNGGSVRSDVKPGVAAALPILTFDHSVTLHVNGEDIWALHYPSGHTDGDSIVYFSKSNVVHMGDDFVTYGFPYVDVLSGGSVKGIIAACEGTMGRLPKDAKVIPGHGPVSTFDDVRRYVTMLKETTAAVEKGVKAGKSIEQLKKDKVLDNWKQYSGTFISADAFTETLYVELTRKKN
ncbi:MAG TPA: MBL fold metallo-hydrolase [Steroidobacteraceae bacterium]|nr:MBL fold metallo-hydrolase [Steroidobacteraceae bacterium]